MGDPLARGDPVQPRIDGVAQSHKLIAGFGKGFRAGVAVARLDPFVPEAVSPQ
jgi:hypothetical protein